MSGNVQTQNQLVTVNETNESENNGYSENTSIIPDLIQQASDFAPDGPKREDFKNNRECTDWVRDNVVNILQSVRNDYVSIHAEWEKINRMLTMEMEDDAKYKGETQVYLPTFAKAIETRTAHVNKSSFPTDSFFDAVALKVETAEESNAREGAKAWMRKQIENAKLRSNFKPFTRAVLSLGVGFLKVWWEDSLVHQKKGRYGYASSKLSATMAQRKPKYCGKLRVKATNNFATYAYPLSVDSLEQCTLIFEDIQVSKQFVETMIKHGYWKEEDIVYASSEPDTERERQESLSQNTQTSQTAVSGGIGGSLGSYTEMSECWFEMPLPKSYFTAEEIANHEHHNPQPMKAIICGSNIIDLQRNPFNHGKPPYLMKKLVNTPDVLITPGYGKMVMTSQYLVNDLVNQVNDNGIYGLNPIILRKLTDIAGHSLKQTISPGAVFDVTEKGAIEFERPPVEQISYGVNLINMANSQVNDIIAPPILQGAGTGGGGAANTATGAQLLQANTKTDIQDFNEDMEQEIFIPLMYMAQSLGQQFESEEMYLSITGQQKIKFDPSMLGVDVSWQWVASSQTINQQLRGQQLGQFLELILNPGVMQMFMQKGITIDIEPVLRKIWEDGLGQRSFESLLIRQQPGATVQPIQSAQSQPALSPEQISAVSQNPTAMNAQTPTTPTTGEGEQFRGVRNEAEGLSGMMGMLGNMPKS